MGAIKPVVYITHKPQDDAAFDFSAAEEYGDIQTCFEGIVPMFNFPRMEALVAEGLKDWKEGDFLILAGNQLYNAMVVAYLLGRYGKITILAWSRMYKSYSPYILTAGLKGESDGR